MSMIAARGTSSGQIIINCECQVIDMEGIEISMACHLLTPHEDSRTFHKASSEYDSASHWGQTLAGSGHLYIISGRAHLGPDGM